MQQLAEVCAKLRRWPRRVSPDHRSLAHECLERACDLFGSSRAVLVIDDGDEPWLNIARLDGGEFTWREEDDLSLESVVDVEIADRAFFIDAKHRVRTDGGDVSIDASIDPLIRADIGDDPVASVPIVAESLQGRLFVCDPKLSPDVLLTVAEPLSALLGIKFEATAQLRLEIREAVEDERTRVARDLHDGLLQSFTGVVLQLETVHSALITDPQTAQRLITQTQGQIMSDQRELRRFVEELRPRAERTETKFDFAARLDELRSRFVNQWGIRLVFDVKEIDPVVSGFIGQETFRLISEAVTNSAKHGRATDVRVGVRTSGSEMQIRVTDNGTGFSFHGRKTLDEMRETGAGPTALAERVSSLNGNLVVDSTETGATVTMTVPLGFGA